MNAALITAIYDDYDTLKDVHPQLEVDDLELICVTDSLTLESDTWRVIREPRPGVHPNRAAKRPKMCPWLYTAARDTVWLDASYRVKSPWFVANVLTFADPIAQFVHPWRDCVYDEANETARLPRYVGENPMQQVSRYPWHPRHWGLWATGVIARRFPAVVNQATRQTHDQLLAFGVEWLRAVEDGSYQDQLTEAPLLNRTGLRPVALDGTHLDNEWVVYEGSARHG